MASGPLRATALIGREPEVAAVRHAVSRAGTGSGGMLLITGEAGVGKSRLIAEAVRLARSMDLAVLVGRAVPDGAPSGRWPRRCSGTSGRRP